MSTRDVGAERDAAIGALEELGRQAQLFADFLRAHPDVTAQASAEDVRAATAFFKQLRTTSRALVAWQRGLGRH